MRVPQGLLHQCDHLKPPPRAHPPLARRRLTPCRLQVEDWMRAHDLLDCKTKILALGVGKLDDLTLFKEGDLAAQGFVRPDPPHSTLTAAAPA